MMKPLLLVSIVFLLCGLPHDTQAQTLSPLKSKADLPHDILVVSDGGYQAEQARKIAVQTQQVDVIAAGITSRSYDTRINCINSLGAFPVAQQKHALVVALSNDSAWEKELAGESRTIQETACQEIVSTLKDLGITATWKDLLNPATRKTIVDQLTR